MDDGVAKVAIKILGACVADANFEDDRENIPMPQSVFEMSKEADAHTSPAMLRGYADSSEVS